MFIKSFETKIIQNNTYCKLSFTTGSEDLVFENTKGYQAV